MNTNYDQFGRPLYAEPDLYDDPSPNGLSIAALICGIVSLLTLCIGGAIIPAALGILLALLSRKRRMCTQAKIGFFMSIGSLALYAVVILLVTFTLSITGILGPLVEKALSTDFSDPQAVQTFQEETMRLLEERLGPLDRQSRQMLGALGEESRDTTLSADRDSKAKPEDVPEDPVSNEKSETDPEVNGADGNEEGSMQIEASRGISYYIY